MLMQHKRKFCSIDNSIIRTIVRIYCVIMSTPTSGESLESLKILFLYQYAREQLQRRGQALKSNWGHSLIRLSLPKIRTNEKDKKFMRRF